VVVDGTRERPRGGPAGGDEPPRGAAARRRRLILESARRVFAERGYDSLSVVAVADRAGIPRSGVYRLYRDRRSLLAAVIENDVEQLVGRLTLSIPPDGDLDRMLEVGVGVFLDFVMERRGEYEVLFGHAGRLDPEVALLLSGLRDRLAETYRRLFKPVLERAREELWPEDESLLVTHAVMALAEGATVAWLVDPSVPRGRVVTIVSSMIRDAISDGGDARPARLRVVRTPPGPRPERRGRQAHLRGVPVTGRGDRRPQRAGADRRTSRA
jgi:AcrR family transcriptional regulator